MRIKFCKCKYLFVFVTTMFLSTLLAQKLLFVHDPSKTATEYQLNDLRPQEIWNYFEDICKIPRASGKEQEISNFILAEAFANKLTAFQDKVGNVIVRIPASSEKYANVPTIAIQCHQDMVTEKDKKSTHDFTKDPIKLVRKGNYIYAEGTTLGADNGMGVATCLALINAKNLQHGPLECVFTVQEETTFAGANNINSDSINGKILINIDSEDHGQIFIGCAGSCDVTATMQIKREKLDVPARYYSISVDGLYGGHSGVDIDKNRISALKIMSFILNELDGTDFRLVSIKGGNKHNAIPRDAEIVISVPLDKEEFFSDKFTTISKILMQKYKEIEPNFNIEKKSIKLVLDVIDKESQKNLLLILDRMLHGVIKMSETLNNIVETSTNFASILTTDNQIDFATMQRSLIGGELKKIAGKVINLFESCNVLAEVGSGTAEWQPNENSQILKLAKETFEKLFNKKPEIKAIHAGLECGAFVNQIPGLDAISFGPTIIDAHSPNEHIDITTVEPFWIFLTNLLSTFADNSLK